MSQRVPPPVFPTAPREYDPRFMSDLIRALTQYVVTTNSPGEGRFTGAVLTNLQDNDQGLEEGAIFEQDGHLMIARSFVAAPASTTLTASLGDVTVTIT